MAGDPWAVAAVVLNIGLGAYGAWQMINGWRARRRGGDREQLMMAGVTRLLLSSGIWVSISFLSGWSDGLSPIAGRAALGVGVVLIVLSLIVDARRRQVTGRAHGR